MRLPQCAASASTVRPARTRLAFVLVDRSKVLRGCVLPAVVCPWAQVAPQGGCLRPGFRANSRQSLAVLQRAHGAATTPFDALFLRIRELLFQFPKLVAP